MFQEFAKVPCSFKVENQELEDDEVNNHDFYKLRRYCVIILGAIETLYEDISTGTDKNYEHHLERYRRIGYHKKGDGLNERSEHVVTSKEIDTKYSINLYNYEVGMGLVNDKEVKFSLQLQSE